MMADALVSALVSSILGNLNNLILEESAIIGNLKSEVENLESKLSTIQAVLHDAEKRQWKSEAIKNWLRKLKDAAYDADDILDELSIEAERQRQQRNHLKNQVRSFFSLEYNPLVFHAKMAHKLKNVRKRLDAIAGEKIQFHLIEGVRDVEVDSFDWRQTSSLVNESEIYGRDKEKEVLIDMVLSNSSADLSVCAICGMGGLGKTTLSQLVYNDRRVEMHFDLRMWVCVSDNFNTRRLTRAILESIESSPCAIQELDPLQQRLREKLNGRKFLLVLDDVWNEYQGKWNELYNALRCGAGGSTVIATTRMEKVAQMMATVPIHYMVRLSDEDSWSLFKQYAFGTEKMEEYAHLEAIGKDIVKRCGGLPLAMKALGSLMRFKRTESDWISIKESDLWKLPDDGKTILPALKLSYDHLSPQLKQCFCFCSMFPKDFEMKKNQLIGLWMANGFVSCRGQTNLHDVGEEIFKELAWRSFFEDLKMDYWGDITCKMHDLVHDLAQSIIKNECCSIQPGKMLLEVPKEVHYLAIYDDIPLNKDLYKIHSVRSFLVPDHSDKRPFHSCLFEHRNLRALDLSGSVAFPNKFHSSISKLKHLRFLDLSHCCEIRTLPESITSLQKLQTLNLRYCINLLSLPKGMKYMKNLIYLDLSECYALRCMPAGIGQLTCLRKLSKFIVGKGDGHHIEELKRLNLEGELVIKDLDNVKTLTDAKSASLVGKKNVKSLKLCWRGDNNTNTPSETFEDVLCGLQPDSDLRKLKIAKYRGSKFPNWVMDLVLPNLVEISLGCRGRCERLPPLGKLKFLKVLCLNGMDVKCIDSELYGDEESSFSSLKSLVIKSMSKLEKWGIVDGKTFSLALTN